MLCGKTDGLVLFSFCIIYYTIAVVLNGKRFNFVFSYDRIEMYEICEGKISDFSVSGSLVKK